MKANLTYSLISADLKQGMYLLINDHLGYVSRMNGDEAIISFYFEDGKVIKLAKQTMTREDAIRTYGESVIKLIAIVDGNPISINHQNYKKIFTPMLTFAKGAEESHIGEFIRTKEGRNPLYGEVSPVYSMLKSGDTVTITSLEVVDRYSLYDSTKRLVKVKEKKSGWRIAAIASAVIGVYFLSGGNTETGSLSFFGLFIVLLSALGYALYLVTMSQLKIGRMKGLLLTFYVFLFGGIFLFIGTSSISHLQPISEWHTAGNLILLALIPTVVSNLALVRAVKSIGSTLTSVLGAMEPVTAVCVGIFLFGEAFTTSIGVGIALIIVAVMVIILKR